MIIIIIR